MGKFRIFAHPSKRWNKDYNIEKKRGYPSFLSPFKFMGKYNSSGDKLSSKLFHSGFGVVINFCIKENPPLFVGFPTFILYHLFKIKGIFKRGKPAFMQPSAICPRNGIYLTARTGTVSLPQLNDTYGLFD